MIRLAAPLVFWVGAASAQGVAFGGLSQDSDLPVEVEAESLDVDQADGSALFSGGVTVAQGDMRLSADEVRIEYAEEGGDIEWLHATGGVTIVAGEDAAEASEATYAIGAGQIVMMGDVLLTQGPNALSGNRLTLDLESGTGRMEGGVRTIFQPAGQ